MESRRRVAFCCSHVLVAWCALFLWSGDAAAQKTDVITLHNGDKITCEIKEMTRGQLRCSTDPMGDVYIKWEYIASIDTDKTLEVELESGQRYYGNLKPADSAGNLAVAVGATTTSIPTDQVAFVKQIDPTFWGRLDGGIDFGTSYTQSDNQFDYQLNANSSYTARRDIITVSLNSQVSIRDEAKTTNRQILSGSWSHDLRWEKWFGLALTSFEHNDDLDLDLRSLGGYGIGRYLAQTNRWNWMAFLSGVYTHELYSGEAEANNNIEAGFGTNFQVFTFGDNETDITTEFIFLPSLTTGGRYRLALSSSLRREFVKDLYFSLNLREAFDSKPPVDTASRNDLSFSVSLGWSY